MRRPRAPRSFRPRAACALAAALLLAGAPACGGGERTDDGAAVAPGEEAWTPGASGAPAESPTAPGAGSAPQAAPGGEPPADAAAAARAEVERLERRVRQAEQELEDARAELARAREALAAAEHGPARSDAAIFRDVQRRLLEDPALARVAIRADVDDGVVVLHGRVPDRDTARTAGAVAAGVDGVVRVESRIAVAEDEG